MAAQEYTSVVQQLYVSYFGRPADFYGLKNFTEALDAMNAPMTFAELAAEVQAQPNGSLANLVANFSNSAESVALYGNENTELGISKFVEAIYKNFLGREADIEGFNFWVGAITSGGLDKANAVAAITAGALQQTSAQGMIDAKVVANKLAIATSFTNALDLPSEFNAYAGAAAADAARSLLQGVDENTVLSAYQANVNATVASIVNGSAVGTTFQLSAGLDTITGTAGNDVIIGSISSGSNDALKTLSSLDAINGGAGIDTLRIATDSAEAITLPNVSNVEVIEVQGASGVWIDTTNVAGVTNLNITKAATPVAINGVTTTTDAVNATAAATTDISVSMQAAGDSIVLTGGKNVNVALTGVKSTTMVDTISVGASNAADPVGAVVVNATAAAAVNGTNVNLGDITVAGGTSIDVTQKVGNAAGLVAGATATKHIQGNVDITAGTTTTTVNVKQDATISAQTQVAITGATEVASVKFTKLDAGQEAVVAGLTFKAAKALTAAEVAQAFANLSASAITPGAAVGDTQGSGIAANGVFTGSLLAGWASSAATGDTVTFTGEEETSMTDLVTTTYATVTTTTQGIDAQNALNRLGVDAGTVTIAGAAALATVTVDGYAASSGVSGNSNAALATVNLSNGTSFYIDSAAASLALNLNKVNGTVNVAAGTKTVNAAVTSGSSDTVTLASASVETVNISGTGRVAGNTTDLSAATAINTSAMTAGSATFTIADGAKTAYTGGAGTDSVTITNATTAITKAVALGAGNDKLTLTGVVALPTATLNGGEGTDTIAINGESAAALSLNGNFAGKIEGFEKLSITDTVAVARTVNMANMDGISYVVSNNSNAVGGGATKEVIAIDFATSGTIVGTDTVAFNGAMINVTANMTPSQIALAFANGTYTNWDLTSVVGSVVTLTAKDAGAITPDVTATNVTIVDTDATTAVGVVGNLVEGNGTDTSESFTIDFGTSGAIEDADTIVFNGKTITLATGDSASQIATKVGGAYANWTAVANGTVVTFTSTAPDFANVTNVVAGDFVITNTKTATTAPAVAVTVTTQGADAAAGVAALTIDKMVNNGTLELVGAGSGVTVTMADATGTADSFNIVTTVVGGDLNFGSVGVAGVETIKVSAMDSVPTVSGVSSIQTGTLNLNANAATALTIDGNSNLTLTLTGSDKLATVNASALTGDLSVSATGKVAMTITSGSGDDTLRASVGTDAKADVINGGAGDDTIYVGSNAAVLTGGEGNDLFIVTSDGAGNKELNTYSDILDFSAGDLLQFTGANVANADSFGKLTAVLNESTATFGNFVNAAIEQAELGDVVWFNYKGDAYLVMDAGEELATFEGGVDMIVKLTGINGDNLSFNTEFGTAGLV